ncbi:dolichol kinase EVAN-like [Malus sylvestris]|uniref:dolichol kinase EVAN-like n=1 Tax=Malus sylvestris TaxID=3752 RepID=UPI0021ACE754|nr:dolichol kinase EVAN-like [Malus sylvestris]
MAAMEFAMAGMMNGERAVVLLFISRVLFSLTISLLALALSLDILTDSSTSLSQFSTRPGASSDILLGAVALPTVFISKTIQLSLAVSLHQVSIEELESLTIRYWAASASCLCVLIFLCITISCASGNIAPPSCSIRHAKFSLSCIILHNAVCCLTLGTVSLTSFETALKLLWMLSHGLAAVKLIQHVLRTFPSCSSIGSEDKQRDLEIRYLLFFTWIYHDCDRIIIDAVGSGFSYASPCYGYFHLFFQNHLRDYVCVPALIFQPASLDLSFGAALAVFLALEIIRVWRIWRLGQSVHKFMNAFTDHRDSDLLIVSQLPLLLGCARPIWMSSGYTDRRLDPFSGILDLGIGDTMVSVLALKEQDRKQLFLNVIVLVVFLCPGISRLTFSSSWKTVEGTAAGITSVLAACSVLLPLLASTGYILTEHWCSLLLAVAVSGMLEAYTAQLVNAFVPLMFYSLLCL